MTKKECWEKWYLEHREERLKVYKKYRLTHPVEIKERQKKWRLVNPNYGKEYRGKNKEKVALAGRKWQQENRERTNAKTRRWQHTPKGKVAKTKNRKAMEAKRRGFGFVLLNKQSSGTEGHHIDMERVIYIPGEMHEINPHSVTKDKGMGKINNYAFCWLEAEELYAQGASERRSQLRLPVE